MTVVLCVGVSTDTKELLLSCLVLKVSTRFKVILKQPCHTFTVIYPQRVWVKLVNRVVLTWESFRFEVLDQNY